MSEILLRLNKISKSFYQEKQQIIILNQLDLAVKTGELVAITGPSGSGKTTLLQIAGLLDSWDSGSVTIDNIEISPQNKRNTNGFTTNQQQQIDQIHLSKIGFIYQENHLLPEFSVLENVAMPLLVAQSSKNLAFEKARQILTKVGLDRYFDYQPNKLSGGQQQRVAIARALVHSPKIILADEPTGNLDSINAEAVFELLKSLIASQNLSCLMVTHNQDLANRADRQIKIKDGAILN